LDFDAEALKEARRTLRRSGGRGEKMMPSSWTEWGAFVGVALGIRVTTMRGESRIVCQGAQPGKQLGWNDEQRYYWCRARGELCRFKYDASGDLEPLDGNNCGHMPMHEQQKPAQAPSTRS
jgi:hypothetical protein